MARFHLQSAVTGVGPDRGDQSVVRKKTKRPPDLAEVRAYPVRQHRSEQNRERLLGAGRLLLQDGGFDEMSIAQLAAHAGCSVGVFYQRFRNKRAYFEFLLEASVQQVREQTLAHLNSQAIEGFALSATIARCVQHYIEIHREHAGLIRAALQYGINGTNDWQPLRESGLWLHRYYMDLILSKMPPKAKPRVLDQGLIGFQMISGHLVNSIAHPGNVLPLEHPELRVWLGRVLMLCLETSSEVGHPDSRVVNPAPKRDR